MKRNDFELIKEMQTKNYKNIYYSWKICDFRPREDKDWKIGLRIKEVK